MEINHFKTISSMYMGELTRQVLVDMVWEGLMFENIDTGNLWWNYNSTNVDTDSIFLFPDPLFEWGNFPTRFVSEIESDPGKY